jgi:hypothetical protein
MHQEVVVDLRKVLKITGAKWVAVRTGLLAGQRKRAVGVVPPTRSLHLIQLPVCVRARAGARVCLCAASDDESLRPLKLSVN